jgi:hypothetical protein
MQRYPQLSDDDVKEVFKNHYYKCIPIDYINYIRLRYQNNIVKRYNRAQISAKIDQMDKNYAKIFSLYNDNDVEEIQIELRFDKMALDVNNKLKQWFEESLEEL